MGGQERPTRFNLEALLWATLFDLFLRVSNITVPSIHEGVVICGLPSLVEFADQVSCVGLVCMRGILRAVSIAAGLLRVR